MYEHVKLQVGASYIILTKEWFLERNKDKFVSYEWVNFNINVSILSSTRNYI